jgi:diadenosine tetraphosphate (Ap4A) HIT family hydrolase
MPGKWPTIRAVGACYVCTRNADIASLPEWDRTFVTERWRLAHAWSALPGWLVLLPRRHVRALDELTNAEADELGPLLTTASAALRAAVGCSKTYVVLFAEKEGLEHLHFHVVPRMPDFEPRHVGPGVFDFINRPEEEWVPVVARNRLSRAIGDFVAGNFATPHKKRFALHTRPAPSHLGQARREMRLDGLAHDGWEVVARLEFPAFFDHLPVGL